MEQSFWETMFITGKLAIWTTLILFIIGLPIAYWLAYKKFFFKPLIEAIISMPLVLPPTVLGFYILIAFSPQNGFGKFIDQYLNLRLAFTFEGILISSIIFGLPFMIQPLQNGFKALPESLREASSTLGKSERTTFFKVLIPNIRPSIIVSIAMTFAHCIGEFGLVIMVGGNIPGQTRVASIAIYDEVQSMNYNVANKYSIILFITSLLLLTIIYSVHSKNNKS